MTDSYSINNPIARKILEFIIERDSVKQPELLKFITATYERQVLGGYLKALQEAEYIVKLDKPKKSNQKINIWSFHLGKLEKLFLKYCERKQFVFKEKKGPGDFRIINQEQINISIGNMLDSYCKNNRHELAVWILSKNIEEGFEYFFKEMIEYYFSEHSKKNLEEFTRHNFSDIAFGYTIVWEIDPKNKVYMGRSLLDVITS